MTFLDGVTIAETPERRWMVFVTVQNCTVVVWVVKPP